MRKVIGGVLLLAALVAVPAVAAAQCDAPGAKVESDRIVVVYRTVPPKIAVGQHFALLFTVCGSGAPAVPISVEVDARMPAHGHGMNYRPGITPLGAGGFRAEGLMLHMPGHWDLEFVVREGGRAERVVHRLDLQ